MSDIKTLSIDIETYSGYDLSKCGVYKYVEHPDFDILLFGYAVNGGEVKVVDLGRNGRSTLLSRGCACPCG